MEMLFPADESPSGEMVALLASMGVTCRTLPSGVAETRDAQALRDRPMEPMSGFTLKIAAVILSSFQEVRPQLPCSCPTSAEKRP